MGRDGGESEEQTWQMERQVYLYGKMIMLDKICVIFSSLVLYVIIQNVGYGGEGHCEATEELLVGMGLGRQKNNVSFVEKGL